MSQHQQSIWKEHKPQGISRAPHGHRSQQRLQGSPSTLHSSSTDPSSEYNPVRCFISHRKIGLKIFDLNMWGHKEYLLCGISPFRIHISAFSSAHTNTQMFLHGQELSQDHCTCGKAPKSHELPVLPAQPCFSHTAKALSVAQAPGPVPTLSPNPLGTARCLCSPELPELGYSAGFLWN